jgi:hypothetical protein
MNMERIMEIVKQVMVAFLNLVLTVVRMEIPRKNHLHFI